MARHVVTPLKTSTVSLPAQVQQDLVSLIANRTFHLGEQLPPRTDLVTQLDVSGPSTKCSRRSLMGEASSVATARLALLSPAPTCC